MRSKLFIAFKNVNQEQQISLPVKQLLRLSIWG